MCTACIVGNVWRISDLKIETSQGGFICQQLERFCIYLRKEVGRYGNIFFQRKIQTFLNSPKIISSDVLCSLDDSWFEKQTSPSITTEKKPKTNKESNMVVVVSCFVVIFPHFELLF